MLSTSKPPEMQLRARIAVDEDCVAVADDGRRRYGLFGQKIALVVLGRSDCVVEESRHCVHLEARRTH
jgi:hypothetical protein